LVLPQQFLSPHHEHEVLYEEEFVCAVWSKNRLVSDRVSLEQLMEMRHVATAPAGGRDRGLSTIDQWWVERIGSTRNVAMVVGTFAAAPPFVVGTNRYTIMHRRLARHFSKTYELKLLSLPIDFPHRTIAMQWNRHRMQDAGIIWLRKQMIAAANKSK
jgi:LysR family transcriptional regulator, nod-box dependent transcriptional activator